MLQNNARRDSSFINGKHKADIHTSRQHSCSGQRNEGHHKRINILLLLLFPLLGLLSLIWFLLRVIPKPSRATYPCQRVAFPLASGFIVWITGLVGSTLAYRKARKLFLLSRRFAALICIIVSVSFIWLSLTTSDKKLQAADPVVANQPIGVGKGVHPGRVAWIHDANAATWTGKDGDNNKQPYWFDNTSTNPQVVSEMMSKSLRILAGADSDAAAWDAIFRNFNEQMGRGNVGYQPGEKIGIKVNFVLEMTTYNGIKSSSYMDQIDCSPQLTIALLKQLTDVVGVASGDISIGDPSACMPNYWYDMVVSKCPGVVYLTRSDSNPSILYGRTPVTYDTSAPFYWSEPDPSRFKAGNGSGLGNATQPVTQTDYVPTQYSQATYFINFAILKSHTQNGITATAKNLFGALRKPDAPGYYSLHQSRAQENSSTGQYRCLVDLVGHPKLGGKTLLCLIDGLYGGRGWDSCPKRWTIPPFNNNWPSSIFLSQDPVAIDSVAYDFLRSQWTNSNYNNDYDAYPQRPGTEDYLHEEALANNPPSGTFYDPNHDGGLKSLGVHENWNNDIAKQYSRNLGTGDGIELVSPSSLATADGPVHNIDRGEKYDRIRDAISAASPYEHIIVSPGIYNENIDFNGKHLTLSSSNPNNPAIVASTIISGGDKAVTFSFGDDANSVITGFTITDANTGICCAGTSPTISMCRIIENKNYGIELQYSAKPNISHCEILCNNGSGIAITEGQLSSLNMPSVKNSIIAANRLYGICCDMSLVNNCTIAANGEPGIAGQWPNISNSIIYSNSRDTGNVQIESSSAIVTYSDIQGGWTGTGNISQDPCFALVGFWDVNGTQNVTTDDTWLAGDYHLLSYAGRWIQSSGWMTDEVSSPCIDAGEPNMSWGDELWPHGKRINMGAYGGSAQASLSLSNAGDIRDLNNDGSVTWGEDVLPVIGKWGSKDAPLKEDLNLDGIVDVNDLVFFQGNWLADSNNTVPQFEPIEDQDVTSGSPLALSISAGDTDGDELVYVAVGLPDGAVFTGQQFTWTPQHEGTYNITFIASDKKSLTFTTIQITVHSQETAE
jgi:hypothetical protein